MSSSCYLVLRRDAGWMQGCRKDAGKGIKVPRRGVARGPHVRRSGVCSSPLLARRRWKKRRMVRGGALPGRPWSPRFGPMTRRAGGAPELAKRNPRLLLRLPGLLLLRLAARALLALLFQLPPRVTRFEPVCLLSPGPRSASGGPRPGAASSCRRAWPSPPGWQRTEQHPPR